MEIYNDMMEADRIEARMEKDVNLKNKNGYKKQIEKLNKKIDTNI